MIKMKKITYYNYLISPKVRLIIRLIKIMMILTTLLNTSPDWYTYIDYIVKNGLEDSEVTYELELTEKQKMYLKIGCIIWSFTITIFLVYVLKNYNIVPLPPTQSIDNNSVIETAVTNITLNNVSVSEGELDKILNSTLEEYEAVNANCVETSFKDTDPQKNLDKAFSEFKAFLEANKENPNLLVMPKFLELEKKVDIAYEILNKVKVD